MAYPMPFLIAYQISLLTILVYRMKKLKWYNVSKTGNPFFVTQNKIKFKKNY